MANGKREFEIKINGITESIDGANKLVDVLEKLDNTTVNVTSQTERANKANKEKKQALTDEEKAQKKLEETLRRTLAIDSELNREQIQANRNLKERTREITLEIQAQNAASNSIEGMRAQLNLLRNEWAKTDVGNERFAELTEEIAELTAKLKEAEAATGDFRRNVGNYESGLSGLDKKLKGFSSSLESSTNLGKSLASTFMMGAGVLGLFSSQSEDTAKATANMQKILGLLSIAQALNNNLIKSGTLLKAKDALAEKARAVQTALSTVATNASSASLKLFSKALIGTGIGAFIVLLGALVAHFDDIKKVVLDTFPALKDFGEYLDEFKAIAAGVGNALITYILTPFRVIGAVVKKVMEGDIKGAFVEGFEEVKKGFNVVENYQKGFEEQTSKNIENAKKERAKLRADELDNVIKDNEAKAGSDWKYTEEGKKAYADLYAAKRIMYAGDIEAMRELQREEWKHLADIQKHTDEEVKKRREAGQRVADARKQALDSYKKALESFQSETHKLELANEQKRIDLARDTAEKLIATTKDELALRNLAIEDSYGKQNAINKKLAEDEIKAVEKTYEELIALAKRAGQATLAIETEKQERLKELRESAAITELTLNSEKDEKIKASNEKFKEDEEKRQKDLRDIQKRWADLGLKDAEDQYRNIEDLREKLLVRDNNGSQLIDIDATRRNLEETDKALNDYISKLQTAKTKLKAIHEENLKTLKKGTPEYEEELNRYADAEYSLNKKIEKANKEKADNTKQTANLVLSYWQDMFAKISEIANGAMDGVNAIFNAINPVYQSQLDELNEKYDEISKRYDEVEKKREESAERIRDFEQQIQEAQGGTALALREQIAREMQAKAELDQEEKRLAKEKEKRETEIAKKEKQMKKAQLVQDIAGAAANIAYGITKALGLIFPLNTIVAALVAASGAVQIGVMNRQLAKMEDGGLLAGPSHANGGMRIQGTNIEVEGGEYVVNKRSTAVNQQLIEYINNSTETVTARDIANLQGIPIGNYNNTPDVQVRDTYTTEDKILKAIEGINFRPVVSVKDINDVQNSVVDVTDIAGID